ncbi:MAG: hypothetical protein ACRDMH_03725, partial [Solirubrobacterales bacterium]
MTILPAATAPFDWADLLDLDDADLRALRAEAAVDLGPELDPDPLPALRDWAAPLLTATAAELGEIEGDRLDLLDWRVVDRFVSGRRERRRERESRERYDQRRRKRLAAKAERERAEAAKSPEQRAAEQAERERHAAADAERAAKLQAAREARWADPILAAQLPSTYIAMVGKAGHERMLRLGRDRLAAGIEHERYSAPVVVRRRSLAGIVREGRGELRQLAGQLDAIERLSEGACWKSIAAMRADLDAARARLRVIARRVRARRRDHDAAMLAMIANAYRIDLADAARPD